MFDKVCKIRIINFMRATLTEAQRRFGKIVRPVIHQGKRVVLTEHGQPRAEISRHVPTVEVSAEELRRGEVTDEAILEALAQARA